LKIKRLVITQDSVVEEVPTAIKPNKATIGPKFRGKAKDVYDALAGMPVEDAAGALETGHLILTFEDGTQAELAKEDVKIEKGLKSHGKMVNSVSVRGLTILVEAR
jgi:hypothetical protein